MEETTLTPGRTARLITRLPRPAVLSKFVFTGAVVGLTHLGLVSGMVVCGIPIQIALAIGYALALAVHFTMNRQWVFASDGGYALHVSAQGGRYLLLAGTSYLVTATATAVLPYVLGIHELAAFALSAIAMAGFTFVMLQLWVFRATPGGAT